MVLFTTQCNEEGKIESGAILEKFETSRDLFHEKSEKVLETFSDFKINGFSTARFEDGYWIEIEASCRARKKKEILKELENEAGPLFIEELSNGVTHILPVSPVYVPMAIYSIEEEKTPV